jgi:glycosyltransferase involved in cell wall biosynthesis
MRILLLAPHPFFSDRGTPIAVLALLRGLRREGHRLTVLTYPEGQDVALPGVEIVRVPKILSLAGVPPGFSLKKVVYDVAMFFCCLGLLRRERFDLIHAVEESAFIALAMRWLHGIPYVYDMDSSLPEQMILRFPCLGGVRRLLEASEAALVRGSTAVVGVCQSLVDLALSYDPDHLAVRLEDFSLLGGADAPAERLDAFAGCQGSIVMYVGNLEAYQGIDLLLEAFALTAPQASDACLVVIGGRPEQIEHYRRRGRDLGIADRAHFIGPRPLAALRGYLEQATILVSPRIHSRNTAMKIYSYIDSGRALLATRLPTHTQVLDDRIALLADPDPASMARGMVRLLREPALRERLAREAKWRVRHEYGPEAFQRKLVAFYDRVEWRLADAATASG